MKNGSNRFIDIYSESLQKLALRIEKAGQDNLQCFDFLDGVLCYSDSECTRLLRINGYEVEPMDINTDIPAASKL